MGAITPGVSLMVADVLEQTNVVYIWRMPNYAPTLCTPSNDG